MWGLGEQALWLSTTRKHLFNKGEKQLDGESALTDCNSIHSGSHEEESPESSWCGDRRAATYGCGALFQGGQRIDLRPGPGPGLGGMCNIVGGAGSEVSCIEILLSKVIPHRVINC
eukprot:4218236-Amphidinium_carterae.1